jgi:hypothetical protein
MKDPNQKIKDTLGFKNKLIDKYMSQGIDIKSNFPSFTTKDTVIQGKSNMTGPNSPLVSANKNYMQNKKNAGLGNALPNRSVTIGQPNRMSYLIQGLYSKDKIDK